MFSVVGSQRLGSSHSSFVGNGISSSQCTLRVQAPARLHICAGQIGPGKKWEHYPLNKNKRVIRPPMHVRSGDTVQIISGKDKGKIGEITDVITKMGQIVVKGVNIKYKTKQPRGEEKGEITQSESPIHHSNAMLYSNEKQVRSRVGHKMVDGKKVRYLLKTDEVIDKL
jgi:large subunit ribosomal protein L24